jgi:hypothetical protein
LSLILSQIDRFALRALAGTHRGSREVADMTLSYKARRRLSLLILVVGMPAYVVLVVSLLTSIERLPFWAEVPVYVVLGVAWILPFRRVFLGVGQADPDAPRAPE